MKCRASFPVYRADSRKLKDNLIEFGKAERFFVCKDNNGKDIRAIKVTKCQEKSGSIYCDGVINKEKCTACLGCQIGVADKNDKVDELGFPSENGCETYSNLSTKFFKGLYVTYPSLDSCARPIINRYNDYTGNLGETNFTNPLIACYLWSICKGKAYVSCSPNQELSLDVALLSGEREGHLDVTLRTLFPQGKFLFVAEGKRDINSLLNDSSREQQKKYENCIEEIAHSFGYKSLFSYVIGGNEDPMYPPQVDFVPPSINRHKFFHDILNRNKRFISIHALRGLGILYIASEGEVYLENTLFELFKNKEVYGLVLGGPIIRNGKNFELGKLADYVSIH